MTDTGKIIGLIEALGGGGGGSGGGVSATVIADAFSTSKAYSAGEYVTKSDKLYVFTADHAAGAWIGTDADEVTVGEELSDVKSAIGSTVTVSGSTPSITAVAENRYICGEVAELTIIVPASGCIDVVFTSGSTPTVLTVTPPTGVTLVWANDFDPTSLSANTTYELNILNGSLGVAVEWA